MIFTKRQVLGVVIGFLGTIMLIVSGASIHADQNYVYVVLIILATLSYATSVNIIKRYLQNVQALTITVGNFLVIMLPAIIVLIYSGFFSQDLLNTPNFKSSIFYLIILSLFGTAIAKVLFNKLVHVATPVFASSVAYLMPIVGVFLGVFGIRWREPKFVTGFGKCYYFIGCVFIA